MKWIVLAGSSNTRKTWTLTESVIALVNTCGAQLVSPTTLPTPHPAPTPDKLPYYDDDTYELLYRGRRIIVETAGDMPQTVDEGFKKARSRNADVLISAARAKSCSGHLATIDSKIASSLAEVYVIGALDNSHRIMSEVVRWRIQQIIDML